MPHTKRPGIGSIHTRDAARRVRKDVALIYTLDRKAGLAYEAGHTEQASVLLDNAECVTASALQSLARAFVRSPNDPTEARAMLELATALLAAHEL
jgi:hypothetical protein